MRELRFWVLMWRAASSDASGSSDLQIRSGHPLEQSEEDIQGVLAWLCHPQLTENALHKALQVNQLRNQLEQLYGLTEVIAVVEAHAQR